MRLPPMVLVLLLWAAGLGAAAQFGKISVIFDDLRGLYGGTGEVGLGLIVSVVGMVGLILGTTAGLLVARIGPKRAIVAAMALGAVVSMVEATLPAYPLLIAARVLEGVSHLTIVVVGPTMIAGLAPEARRALAMTLWSSFFGVTYAILAVAAPPLVTWGGIPALFFSHAAWMALLGVVLAVALPRDPPRQPGRMGNIVAEHLAIYASPRLAAPAMGFCFYTFLYVAVLTLLPPETPLAERALMATGMPLVSIVVSLTLGVRLLGRMSAVRLVQWGYAAAIPGFVILGLCWGQGWGMVLGGFWLSAALGIVQGASFAAIPELNATADTRARASGAVAQLGNLGTTTGTPLLAALLAGAGPWALVAAALALCAAGVVAHSVQARRRQLRST
ncbi:MAG: MFS transporter [Rhodobacter sp.]|nr:MFS transporter [Rhodobacter sp.]